MSQNTIAASAEGVMRNALETIASAHRFNLAAMRPHEVHEVVFNALEAADAAKSSTSVHQAPNSHLRQAVAQAQSVEHAAQLGIAVGAEAAYRIAP